MQILWPYTRVKMLNCSWFQSFVSDLVKQDPILDQYFMITRPYPRLNCLKTIPFPVAHTHIASDGSTSPPCGVVLEVGCQSLHILGSIEILLWFGFEVVAITFSFCQWINKNLRWIDFSSNICDQVNVRLCSFHEL